MGGPARSRRVASDRARRDLLHRARRREQREILRTDKACQFWLQVKGTASANRVGSPRNRFTAKPRTSAASSGSRQRDGSADGGGRRRRDRCRPPATLEHSKRRASAQVHQVGVATIQLGHAAGACLRLTAADSHSAASRAQRLIDDAEEELMPPVVALAALKVTPHLASQNRSGRCGIGRGLQQNRIDVGRRLKSAGLRLRHHASASDFSAARTGVGIVGHVLML